MKNIKTGTYVYNNETYNFNFATDLSAYRKMMFVNYVVNSLIDDNRYDSIVRDMIFDFGLISIFTNIDTSFVDGIDDEDNVINPIIFIEQFLEETNVVDIIKANMEVGLFEELNNAVNISIQYRTGIYINPLNEALARLANTLEKKVNEVDLDKMMKMAKLFANMTDELTPESVVNAYMNSDIHKRNIIEIEEAKKQKSKETTKKTDKKIDKPKTKIKTRKKVETEEKLETESNIVDFDVTDKE